MEIKLAYTPLRLIGGEVSGSDFDLYLSQPRWGTVAAKFAIEPLEDAMKEQDKPEFVLGDLKVTRKMQKNKTTSWQAVYTSLVEFLKTRAADGRQFEMDGVRLFEGLGYCILTGDFKDAVARMTGENTSVSEFPRLYWPRMKDGEEFPHEILLPDVDYRKVTPENARIVLAAKRFCGGLEEEVAGAFKKANQAWFESETGYNSKNKLPVKEDSPVRRLRMIAGNKPVFIQLVREDVPQYQEAIGAMLAEIGELELGGAVDGYRVKREEGKGVYINIKSVQDRMAIERLQKDKMVTGKGRYEIVP